MKRWKIITVLLLCLALAGAVACRPIRGGGNEDEFTGKLFEVVRDALVVSVSGSGFIDLSNEVSLAFDGGGKIDQIYIEKGDEVSTGRLLMVLVPLDRGILELAVTQAEIALLNAELNLDKAANPFTDEEICEAEEAVEDAEDFLELAEDMLRHVLRHGSQWEVLQWQMEVFRAESSLKMAEDTLEDILDAVDEDEVAIRELEVIAAEQALAEARSELEVEIMAAPFTGVVASVNVEEGDVIPPPSVSQIPIVDLIDTTSMELSVELDEIDIPDVETGQRAVISIDALPELELEGRVISVSPLPTVEAGVVLYSVKISFGVPEVSGIRVGMSATADIITSERSNVVLVPDRAINRDSQGRPVVYVMIGEDIEERSVVVGISDGFQTEIKTGLEEGEIVVIEIQPRQDALERMGFGSR